MGVAFLEFKTHFLQGQMIRIPLLCYPFSLFQFFNSDVQFEGPNPD